MDTNIGYVYKITNPNNRVYVGSTIDLERRIYQYKNNYFKAQIKIHRSIEKYGWENHIFEVIWTGNLRDMLKKEAEFGLKLNVLDKDNLNLMLPKINDEFSCISEETRLKMSNSAKGKIVSDYCKKRVSETHTGKIVSAETRKKMSEWQIGRKMSEEAKSKMRVAKLGRIISEKTRQVASDLHSIPILQLDLEENLIKEWKSAAEAANILNLNAGHIRTCCRGERKTHGKFKWKNK